MNDDTFDSQEMLETKLLATRSGYGVDFRYVIPLEGAVQWFETLAIPADAPRLDEAHAGGELAGA